MCYIIFMHLSDAQHDIGDDAPPFDFFEIFVILINHMPQMTVGRVLHKKVKEIIILQRGMQLNYRLDGHQLRQHVALVENRI